MLLNTSNYLYCFSLFTNSILNLLSLLTIKTKVEYQLFKIKEGYNGNVETNGVYMRILCILYVPRN